MPVEFENTDELRGARFTEVDLSGARFRSADFRGVKVVDSMLTDASFSGLINGLRINDVEVAPLVEAELDRRYPERVRLRAKSPEEMRVAWALIEELWSATVDRARALPAAALHRSVDEEWTFCETLRHLIFATDAWIKRTILGVADPFHPFGKPQDGFGDATWIGIDSAASPTLDEILAVRAERMAIVSSIVAALTPEELDRTCAVNPVGGYPAKTDWPVAVCLLTVLTEEWSHHHYAVRDLAVLEGRP